ncbi:hypothetical protein OG455_27200 [Kitasatospora sp. NBC_01287]|uniref:hypothetical protein n=1 Tax=Kitasatospora sp. NBC_01287 TaxID=2903573 RepID=UPI0022550F32|nr:hypothetical protein [Kitasatospora sp. NBC_01287]MCX4749151.1 hypothetical protein [Kitasatospora sp. NBC_01287]
MTPIELERITAHSYAGAPIGLDAQPVFVSALTAIQARETAERNRTAEELRGLKIVSTRNLWAAERPPVREMPPRGIVWLSQGSGKSMTVAWLASAVHRIHDLVIADGSHRALSFTTLLDTARARRGDGRANLWHGLQEAVLDNSSPDAAGSPDPEAWGLAAWKYSSGLARLHSSFELAAELAARYSWPPDASPSRPTGTEDLPQPLAIACGITRLQAPLIPRAPGRPGAAGRFGVGVHGLSLGLAA